MSIAVYMFNKFSLSCLFILALILPFSGSCHSPRLIVSLGPKCDFKASELQREVGGNLVFGGIRAVKKKIIALDSSDPNHLMITRTKIKNLKAFAREIGYDTLYLNGPYDLMKEILDNTLATIPLTEADLPKTDPVTVGLFYELLMQVDCVFKEHDLSYWLTCGSLLGAVRHQGMIPWDDDVDIAIFNKDLTKLLELEEVLSGLGLEMFYYPKYEFYKIFSKNGRSIVNDDGSVCAWTYPFIDVFPLVNLNGKYTYGGKIWQPTYKNKDYYTKEDLCFPLSEMAFGPLILPVPHHATDYVKRMYGKDWNDVAFVNFSHKDEKFLKKIKVDLTERSPPAYILLNDGDREVAQPCQSSETQ